MGGGFSSFATMVVLVVVVVALRVYTLMNTTNYLQKHVRESWEVDSHPEIKVGAVAPDC